MRTKLIINEKIEGIFKTKAEAKLIARKRMRSLINGTVLENSLIIKYEKL